MNINQVPMTMDKKIRHDLISTIKLWLITLCSMLNNEPYPSLVMACHHFSFYIRNLIRTQLGYFYLTFGQ